MRKSWDEYFIDLCDLVATRSTCDRKAVGAVIVKNKRILSTGYNGSIAGQPHCSDAGHLLVDNHCIRVIHSEQSAIFMASKFGIALEGASIYCNTFPCWNCFKAIISSGIAEIVYRDDYISNEKDLVVETAKNIPIILRQFGATNKAPNKRFDIEEITKRLGGKVIGPITDSEVIKRIRKKIK